MNKICYIFLFFVYITPEISAQSPYKISNPEELKWSRWVDPFSSDCVDTILVKNVIEGVIIRSRVKPIEVDELTDRFSLLAGENFLHVKIDCRNLENNPPIFNVDVRMAHVDEHRKIWYHELDFGSLGLGHADFQLEQIKRGVESIMTSIVNVNFLQ